MFGVAVSQDLLCLVNKKCRRNVALCKKDNIHYGDVLLIEGVGYRIVNDVMNERHKKRLDVLVFTYQEEKRFGERKLRAYLLN